MIRKRIERLKETSGELREEISNNIVAGVTAAFGLVIALTWKDVVTEGVNFLIARTGLSQKEAFGFRIVTAIIITFVSVVGITLIARFMGKKSKARKVNHPKEI